MKYGVTRPSLTSPVEDILKLLTFYQGDTENAESEAQKRLKVYATFEKYNALSRGEIL